MAIAGLWLVDVSLSSAGLAADSGVAYVELIASHAMNESELINFMVTTFALMNPLGVLPIFIGLTARENRDVQRLVALFVALTVLALLLVFLFVGESILQFLGVSMDAFRIAGGILLLLMGLKIVSGDGGDSGVQASGAATGVSELKEAETVFQKIVIPMAMPLLVGPGVIANVILYAAKDRADHDGSALLLGTFLLSVVVLAIFLAGRWLKAVVGPIGLNILMRVMGLMVAAMGVQFMVTGVSQIFITQLAPAIR
ncbi:MAG: MarC family protein [Cyanobacteriota bacterium]